MKKNSNILTDLVLYYALAVGLDWLLLVLAVLSSTIVKTQLAVPIIMGTYMITSHCLNTLILNSIVFDKIIKKFIKDKQTTVEKLSYSALLIAIPVIITLFFNVKGKMGLIFGGIAVSLAVVYIIIYNVEKGTIKRESKPNVEFISLFKYSKNDVLNNKIVELEQELLCLSTEEVFLINTYIKETIDPKTFTTMATIVEDEYMFGIYKQRGMPEYYTLLNILDELIEDVKNYTKLNKQVEEHAKLTDAVETLNSILPNKEFVVDDASLEDKFTTKFSNNFMEYLNKHS